MPTVRPSRTSRHDPEPFTDVRTVVIVLLALALSVGAGLSAVAVMTATGTGSVFAAAAGLSATGSTMAAMTALLHRLIAQ